MILTKKNWKKKIENFDEKKLILMGQLKRLTRIHEFCQKTDYDTLTMKYLRLLVQLESNYDTKTIEIGK